MIQNKLRGVGAAMITPFFDNGEIDFDSLGRVIDYTIEGGVDYIVALGTTAETPTLYVPERVEIAAYITERVARRVPLVIGIGGNSTSEVLDQIREIDLSGADAILSVTPYYNKPSQEGLFQHFRVVAENSPLPIILYNIPGRSGVNMTADTTLRIARELPKVIGIKEASGKMEQIEQIIARRAKDFLVLSGDDAIAVDVVERGGDGVISVAVNAFPQRFTALMRLAREGKFEEAHKAYGEIAEAVRLLFCEGNPTGIKCALTTLGLIGETMRLPLVAGTIELSVALRAEIEQHNLK